MLRTWASATFLALWNRDYRLLFAGTVFAQLSFSIMPVVQGIVAFELTGKNGAVGLVALGMGVPMVVLGPIGGALGDRFSKRRLLLISQAVGGVSFAAVGVMILTGSLNLWMLVLSTLVLGCSISVLGPTRQAWVGELLRGHELANGIALQQIAMNLTRILGPFAAGALIAAPFIGTGGTYLLMAGGFALVLVTLAFMPGTRSAQGGGRSVLGDLKLGASYIWQSREIRLLIFVFAGIVLAGFSYQPVLPGLLENELGRKAADLGPMYGVSALGGIVITLFLAGRPPKRPRPLMFGLGFLVGGSVIGLALAPNWIFALVAMAVIGAVSSGFHLLNSVTLMERCDPVYYGRVMAVTMMAFGLHSVFSFPVGLLADAVGERPAIAAGGVATIAITGAGVLIGRAQRVTTPVAAGAARAGSPEPPTG